ncbi:HNH endonuclease [Synechococcus elongatus]|uniref:HNH endonuclease n=1 Tax=Synechococcus elongatus PCC 11802 TaxID=2283154 RepID=A0AAT9K382_SYNEL|nr:HNH endonuclease [Synechococcus elongatus]QFZ91255.1 HNH endonuclease [Synechococcus elongatus PCC 11802]
MPAAPQDLGPCPLCDRPLWKDRFVDRHHFLPRSHGGKEWLYVHQICHRKIHSLFSEQELALFYNTPDRLRSHPEVQRFLKWVRRHPPDFYDRHDPPKHRRR